MKHNKLKIDIFLDMDDTLVATSPLIQKKYNHPNFWIHSAPSNKNPFVMWKNLNIWLDVSKNPIFWEELEPKESYNDLFLLAKQFDNEPKILTALPKYLFKKDSTIFNSASGSKMNWLKKHLPEILPSNVFFTYSKFKHLYINSSSEVLSVLIDDNKKICDKWIQSGGIAYQIKAENHKKSIEDIEKHLAHLQELINNSCNKDELLKLFKQHKI